MKVLYIDDMFPNGHVTFNKIQINALRKKGADLSFILRKGMSDYLDISRDDILFEVNPSSKTNNPLLRHYRILKRYRYISKKVKWDNFDYVIVSFYDDWTILFSKFPKGTCLINHTNVGDISQNVFRRFLYKLSSKKYTPLCIKHDAWSYLKDIGISNAILINHGLILPWEHSRNSTTVDNGEHILFIPGARGDKSIVKRMFSNHNLYKTLDKYNIVIISKLYIDGIDNSRIKFISNIPYDKYVQLFLSSDVILIPYPSNYNYRFSGILLEAIQNNKKLLVTNSPNFQEYSGVLSPENYYDNEEDLIEKIGYFMENPERNFLNTTPEAMKVFVSNYSFLK